MNTFCVDIINKQTVKPSSPTPPHLQYLKLSDIDQQEPPVPVSLVVFFSPSAGALKPDEATRQLKKSLPDVLTLFYPLAGRVNGNQFIECNDQGINLFEACVITQLAQVVTHPADEELIQLLPNDNFSGSGPKVLLSIQINVFECGGMALGFQISHKIADASSVMFFINTWAASTRSACGRAAIEIVPPKFGTAPFFPPKHTDDVDIQPFFTPQLYNQIKLASRRIIFSASDIAKLQARCCTKSYTTPTRVEAVTAFIWSCTMMAAETDSTSLMVAMNLRSRMDPPLPSSFFGNLNLGLLVTSTATDGSRPDLDCLALKVHQEIRNVDFDYVKKLQADHGILAIYNSYAPRLYELSLKGGVTNSIVSSLCRFRMYEADFGWGKPEWVTFANFRLENLTFLTDTKCGTGIEVWITLDEMMMSRFECNPDVIDFTS